MPPLLILCCLPPVKLLHQLHGKVATTTSADRGSTLSNKMLPVFLTPGIFPLLIHQTQKRCKSVPSTPTPFVTPLKGGGPLISHYCKSSDCIGFVRGCVNTFPFSDFSSG
ncbi:hypothetical protein CDAR_127591 [Caerostris darwini]|uniref:Secreted protein n=1 Tax=Caerostris darwini TaxID=1538125 RepID=A0AAV4UUT5_9ARAC|nr:hypothetical protein CDAR_127591 [Caerostris darwini]